MEWNIDTALGAMGQNNQPGAPQTGLATVPQAENPGRGQPVPVKVAMVKTASKAVGAVIGGLAEIATIAINEQPNKKHPNGFICESVDEEDVETLETAVAEGFLVKYPDADIPWWLGGFLAAGNMFIQARKTRTPRLGTVESVRPELKSVPQEPVAGTIKTVTPDEPTETTKKDPNSLTLPNELGGNDSDSKGPSDF